MVYPGFAVHAHHAEVQRIAGGEAADAQQGHSHRKIARAHELLEHTHRAGNHDSVSGQNERALGRIQQLDRAVKVGLLVVDTLPLGRKVWRRSLPIEITGSLLRILGYIHKYGTRPPRTRDHERLAQSPRDVPSL